MKSLLNADDDWIEQFRRYLYPRLHEPLSSLGRHLGVPLYATGPLYERQYVGYLEEDEETIEEELVELSSERNPVAALKSLPDGRVSEGSWVFYHEDYPDLIAEGMQLHLTLFTRSDGKAGRAIYAHYEDSWKTAPLAHLRSANFSPEQGVEKATEVLNNSSFLVLK